MCRRTPVVTVRYADLTRGYLKHIGRILGRICGTPNWITDCCFYAIFSRDTHARFFSPGESRVQPTTCWIKVRVHSWRASLGAERSQGFLYGYFPIVNSFASPSVGSVRAELYGPWLCISSIQMPPYLHNKRPHITSNKYCSQLHIGPFLILNVTKVSMCTECRMTKL